MRIYLSGAEVPGWEALLAEAGASNVLASYYGLGGSGGAPKPPPRGFASLLLDSGGFSARTRGVQIDIHAYARYLNEHRIELAFNLDTNDVAETLANQAILVKECPATTIIPVYHISDYASDEHRDLLRQFEDDGFDFVGLGGVVRSGFSAAYKERFYRHSFRTVRDRVRLHGLGITGETTMRAFPWFSVDSTSWLAPTKYGRSSTLGRSPIADFERHGLDYKDRLRREIARWLEIEQQLSRLWAGRGVTWQTGN